MASDKILIKRGLFADLPDLDDGELGFVQDKGTVYIGTETATNILLNPVQVASDGYTLDGYLYPAVDNVHGLGTPDKRWANVSVGPGSFHIIAKATDPGFSDDMDYVLRINSETNNFEIVHNENILLSVDSEDGFSGGSPDAAIVPDTGATGDGYLAFYTGVGRNIAGDNDLYWDRANNILKIVGSTAKTSRALEAHGGINQGVPIVSITGGSTTDLDSQTNSWSGASILGLADIDTGGDAWVGVAGYSTSTGSDGWGVWGESDKGIGVAGWTDGGTKSVGVMGIASNIATSGVGVIGVRKNSNVGAASTAAPGAGVLGYSDLYAGTAGISVGSGVPGVFGTATTGDAYGVYGAGSGNGAGVYGTSSTTGVPAILGATTIATGIGVVGITPSITNPSIYITGWAKTGVAGVSGEAGGYGIGGQYVHDSVYGEGVEGYTNYGAGVGGYSTGGDFPAGVVGATQISVTNGAGVLGVHGFVETNNAWALASGAGVLGYSDIQAGVIGYSSASGVPGVKGVATTGNANGVEGTGFGTGAGVWGSSILTPGDLSVGGNIVNKDLSETFAVIRQSLDGYANLISGLDSTEVAHVDQQNQINQSILQSLDGYATSLATTVSETTFQENKNAQQQVNQTILQSLDGYATLISSLDTTQTEHQNQQNQINQTIIQGLDGYATASDANARSDGYVAFFTSTGANIQGDNDLYWDRVNNRLGIGTTAPTARLQVASADSSAVVASSDSNVGVNGTGADVGVKGTGTGRLEIAVADSGKLATSNDTATWTQRTSSFSSNAILGVAHNGKDLWVAVGEASTVASSPDGITWTQRSNPFGFNVNKVRYNGKGLWVAVGDGGYLATSTNGTTWTARTSSFGSDNIYNVAYNGKDQWVAVGDGGPKLATSPDGINWTQQASHGFQNAIRAITWSANAALWVGGAQGTQGLRTSPDGITWTQRTNVINTTQINAIAYNGKDLLVAVAAGNHLATSANGTSWTDQSATASFGSDNINSVCFDGQTWIAVGGAGKIATSPDGITWTQQSSSFSGTIIRDVAGGYGINAGTTGYGSASNGTGVQGFGGGNTGAGVEGTGAGGTGPGGNFFGGAIGGIGVVGLGGGTTGSGGEFVGASSGKGIVATGTTAGDFHGDIIVSGAATIAGSISIGGNITNRDLDETFQVIRQALDGYGASVSEQTFQENKNAQYQVNQTIIQALDGYAIETTFQQNKNAQYQVNQTILQALDGYVVVPNTSATGDGYLAFFTSAGTAIAGDNDLFYDRVNSRLGINTTPYGGFHMLSQAMDTTPTAFTTDDFIIGGAGPDGGTNTGSLFFRYNKTQEAGFIGSLSPGVTWRTMFFGAHHTVFQNSSGGSAISYDGANNLNAIRLRSDGSLFWSQSTDATDTPDTGISKISAGILAIGNGTQGDASGTLNVANINVAGNINNAVLSETIQVIRQALDGYSGSVGAVTSTDSGARGDGYLAFYTGTGTNIQGDNDLRYDREAGRLFISTGDPGLVVSNSGSTPDTNDWVGASALIYSNVDVSGNPSTWVSLGVYAQTTTVDMWGAYVQTDLGIGVNGWSGGGTSPAGVVGQLKNGTTTGAGVLGVLNAGNTTTALSLGGAAGVVGYSALTAGVKGISAATAVPGVLGTATTGDGYGVHGIGFGASAGVYGVPSAASTPGVKGVGYGTPTITSRAVEARAIGTKGTAFFGVSGNPTIDVETILGTWSGVTAVILADKDAGGDIWGCLGLESFGSASGEVIEAYAHNGTGVAGYTEGTNAGIMGHGINAGAIGVLGVAGTVGGIQATGFTATAGAGVGGYATQVAGVKGVSGATGVPGVIGYATTGNADGVEGYAAGNWDGVYGESGSGTGNGVQGYAYGGGAGVKGVASTVDAYGVYGTGFGTGAGVFGKPTGAGPGGVFEGGTTDYPAIYARSYNPTALNGAPWLGSTAMFTADVAGGNGTIWTAIAANTVGDNGIGTYSEAAKGIGVWGDGRSDGSSLKAVGVVGTVATGTTGAAIVGNATDTNSTSIIPLGLGAGVLGYALAEAGVKGVSASANVPGVSGYSTNVAGAGVFGYTTSVVSPNAYVDGWSGTGVVGVSSEAGKYGGGFEYDHASSDGEAMEAWCHLGTGAAGYSLGGTNPFGTSGAIKNTVTSGAGVLGYHGIGSAWGGTWTAADAGGAGVFGVSDLTAGVKGMSMATGVPSFRASDGYNFPDGYSLIGDGNVVLNGYMKTDILANYFTLTEYAGCNSPTSISTTATLSLFYNSHEIFVVTKSFTVVTAGGIKFTWTGQPQLSGITARVYLLNHTTFDSGSGMNVSLYYQFDLGTTTTAHTDPDTDAGFSSSAEAPNGSEAVYKIATDLEGVFLTGNLNGRNVFHSQIITDVSHNSDGNTAIIAVGENGSSTLEAGHGLYGIGGTSSTGGGTGVIGVAGGTSGVGGKFFGDTSGAGIIATGGSSGNGGTFTGGGGSAGVSATGGTSNGNGVTGTGGATNGKGVVGQGTGSGTGVQGTGGSTDGYGGNFTGGSTNGPGAVSNGTGTGAGIIAIGGSSGYGVVAKAGSGEVRCAFRLVPQQTPTTAEVGDLYVDSNDRKLKICTTPGYPGGPTPAFTTVGAQT